MAFEPLLVQTHDIEILFKLFGIKNTNCYKIESHDKVLFCVSLRVQGSTQLWW